MTEAEILRTLAETRAKRDRAVRLYNRALQAGKKKLADTLRMKVVLAEENFRFAADAHGKLLNEVCGDYRVLLKHD